MASILKVDTIQDQAGNNIISEAANVITIGASGDTITVPAGATVSGFTSAGIDDNADATAITIDSSERVGIGTSSPAQKLHISSGGTTYLRTENTGISTVTDFGTDGTGSIVINRSAKPFRIFTNSTERVRVDATGSLLAGTTTSLQGTSHSFQALGTSNSFYAGTFKHNGSGASGRVFSWQLPNTNQSSSYFVYATNDDGNCFNIFGNGNTEIRNSSPIVSLVDTGYTNAVARVDGSAGWLTLKADNNNAISGTNIRFDIDGSEKARLTSDGRLGIGTSSPSSKLEATGTILASVDGTGLKSVGANAQVHADASSGYGALIADGASGQSSHIFFQTAGTDKARLTADSSGNFLFGAGGATERIRITSAGKIGINTTDPKEKLDSRGAVVISGDHVTSANAMGTAHGVMITSVSGSGKITAISNGANDVNLELRALDGGSANANQLVLNGGANAVIFGDSSNTSPATSSTATHSCFKNGGSKLELSASSNPCLAVNRVNSEGTAVELRQAGGLRGSISVAGATASFNTSSDYRLKENVSYDFDATTRLKELKPARFNFIADANKTVDGFLAHEVSNIVPEAITGTKDAVDDDGNIKPQQIDQAKLVPLLVKTIQELEARITTLEANNP